jgi:type IV pilus assembly protein PilX
MLKMNTMMKTKQTGSALIVSLVLLIMLTLLGITSMSNTVLEQRMAGNGQEKQLSFSFAEIGLREGEALAFNTFPARRDPNDGVYDHSSGGFLTADNGVSLTADPSGFFDTPPSGEGIITFTGENVSGGSTISYTTDQTAQPPQYVLENLGQSRIRDQGRKLPKVTRFRVTSRGFGLAQTTQTFLQSTVGKLE